MSDLRLRARSATELVDAAFALYRRQPLPYVMLTALAYAPWLVLQLILLGARPANPLDSRSLVISFVIALGNLITYSIMSAALVRLVSQEYFGEAGDVGVAIRDVLPRASEIISAALIKGFLLGVGAFFFLIGMFYVAARFFAVNQAIILERRAVIDAFRRSGTLSKGRKWHILGTLALVFFIYILGSIAIGVVGAATRSTVLTTVLTTAYVVVAYPMFSITETLLYYDARIRGEGFDIEVLAGGLDAPAPAAEGLAP